MILSRCPEVAKKELGEVEGLGLEVWREWGESYSGMEKDWGVARTGISGTWKEVEKFSREKYWSQGSRVWEKFSGAVLCVCRSADQQDTRSS